MYVVSALSSIYLSIYLLWKLLVKQDNLPRATHIGSVLLLSSADHRDECTLDNPHTAAPVGGARLAIRRASFATSDCWQSTQLRGGLDHAPASRRCSNISQNVYSKWATCIEDTRLSCSSRLSAAPQLRARKWPRFDSAAGLGQIPLIPVQTPYLILRVTCRIWFRIGTNPGKWATLLGAH